MSITLNNKGEKMDFVKFAAEPTETAAFDTKMHVGCLICHSRQCIMWHYDWRLLPSASMKTFYLDGELYVIKISVTNRRRVKIII